MTSIDNGLFTFKRIKDTFVLVNKTNSILSYTLTIGKCNDIDEVLEDSTVLENETIILNITKDGYYKLNIEGTVVYFSNWKGLRTALIPLIKQALCVDCGCSSISCLPKEAIDCLKNQSLFNFIQTYKHLIKPYSISTPVLTNPVIFNFIERVIQDNLCSFRSRLCNQLFETTITGQTTTDRELFNYHIAITYLALYNEDIQAIDGTVLSDVEVTVELIYLKKVYQFSCIEKCINKLGLNLIQELTVDMSNTLVYYWQIDSLVDDIGDIAPLINQPFILTKSNQSFDVFKDGFIINCVYVGRVAFIVQATISQSFLILDSMGLDITDNFEVQYFAPLSAVLFVSKEVVVPSNLYFKFKTILDD